MLDNRATASVRVAAASRLIEVSLKAKNELT